MPRRKAGFSKACYHRGIKQSFMTKPPAGASLLFTALADTGRIKQRRNGSFQMEIEDVDSINWFTDRPERAEGTWKPKKLIRQWDKYFADSEPNAQSTFRVGDQLGEQGFANFEMFKPKISGKNMLFKLQPISNSGKDKITALTSKEIASISLFIDQSDSPIRVEIPPDYKNIFWTNPSVGSVPVKSGDPLGVALFYGSWNEFKQVMSAAELLPWVNSAGESGFVAA